MKNSFSLDGLFDFSEISPQTQQHLRRVYSYLSSGIALAIICFFLAQYFPSLSGFFTILGIIAFIADIIMIFLNRDTPMARRVSFAALYGYGASTGGSLGGYIGRMDDQSRMINYRYCMSAFLSLLIIFIMFTVFSILTSNRSRIYLYTFIASIVLSLLSVFLYGYSTVLGVIVGGLYISMDTQNIIYRAKNTTADAVMDAKMLFVDMVKLFYKIYEYLQKKDKKDKDKKNK